jgi:hypothetical protein
MIDWLIATVWGPVGESVPASQRESPSTILSEVLPVSVTTIRYWSLAPTIPRTGPLTKVPAEPTRSVLRIEIPGCGVGGVVGVVTGGVVTGGVVTAGGVTGGVVTGGASGQFVGRVTDPELATRTL